jgi:hypothetical protein
MKVLKPEYPLLVIADIIFAPSGGRFQGEMDFDSTFTVGRFR